MIFSTFNVLIVTEYMSTIIYLCIIIIKALIIMSLIPAIIFYINHIACVDLYFRVWIFQNIRNYRNNNEFKKAVRR